MRFGTARLGLTFAVAVAAWLLVQECGQTRQPRLRQDAMVAAAARVERAFAAVDSAKRSATLAFPDDSPVRWRALMGEDYTVMTTTLGSREAKEVSTNPAWASLLLQWLDGCGVTPGDTVAVLASGSFPALTLAAVAATVELQAVPLVISSLGASSFGANVERATWLDLERWVREAGVMNVRSALVTAGGENDAGAGLTEEGRAWVEAAARRNGAPLARFGSLEEAVSGRLRTIGGPGVAAVVNIGGGQAALGDCPHAATLPTGPWGGSVPCHCPGRGVLTRTAERGVPVIHLLGIRGLAARYGLDFEPGGRYRNTGDITMMTQPHRGWIVAGLSAILLSLAVPGRTQP